MYFILCVCECSCIWVSHVHEGRCEWIHVCVQASGGQKTTSGAMLQVLSHWFLSRGLSLAWPANPSDPRVSASPVTGLQTHASHLVYVTSGLKLKSLCLQGKPFTKWIIHQQSILK